MFLGFEEGGEGSWKDGWDGMGWAVGERIYLLILNGSA